VYRPLSRPYAPRVGVMVVERIDTRLFIDTYFAACMDCTFCHDLCCQYGATVEMPLKEAILARAEELEPVIGRPSSEWFDDEFQEDSDYAGGGYVRTRVYDGRCVFLNRKGRGCLLHSHALTHGIPVHEIKPLACNLFPIGWGDGALTVPPEIDERELICLGPGPTLYRSARADVLYYYGSELIQELDSMEAEELAKVGSRSLPLV
jgi:Fe-S-cluster containining protein